MDRWCEIFDFWFGEPGSERFGEAHEFWFKGGAEADEEIHRRFADDYRRATSGEYDDWRAARHSCVALIVLLDQFPRNIYRGRPQSFAADPLALAAAQHAVAKLWHAELTTVEKLFVSLPFQHSELLDDQHRCVALLRAMDGHPHKQEWIDYAVRHRDIIERFGRFPHRNDILGRGSTIAERAWLADGGERFGIDAEAAGKA